MGRTQVLPVWVTASGSVKPGVWRTIAMCPGEHVASHTRVCTAWHSSGPWARWAHPVPLCLTLMSSCCRMAITWARSLCAKPVPE